MRRSLLIVVFAAIVTLIFAGSHAQQPQLPQLKPPPPAPVKPYQAVAVAPPAAFNDPALVAFRKQLADVAAHKDRAALAKMVVTQNFFWLQDKNLADKRKSGVDNLAKAIELDAKDGPGWDILAAFANESSAAEFPEHNGAFCAPADPQIDPKALEALGAATGTDPSEWGYPNKGSLEVHAAAQPNSPVIDKLGAVLVRVLPDSSQPSDPQALALHVATPSGKTGYADAAALSPLTQDEICYAKDGGGWKIAGYLGGVSP